MFLYMAGSDFYTYKFSYCVYIHHILFSSQPSVDITEGSITLAVVNPVAMDLNVQVFLGYADPIVYGCLHKSRW